VRRKPCHNPARSGSRTLWRSGVPGWLLVQIQLCPGYRLLTSAFKISLPRCATARKRERREIGSSSNQVRELAFHGGDSARCQKGGVLRRGSGGDHERSASRRRVGRSNPSEIPRS